MHWTRIIGIACAGVVAGILGLGAVLFLVDRGSPGALPRQSDGAYLSSDVGCTKEPGNTLDTSLAQLQRAWRGHLELVWPPNSTGSGSRWYLAVGTKSDGSIVPFLAGC
jgi:hypothetical protein